MNVRFTPRALSEAKRIKRWWQKNRPAAPNLFDEEMAATVGQLRTMPAIGAFYPASFEATVRRVLLPKTQNHVYYAVHDDQIVVLSVWGAPRRRGPKL